MWAHSSILLYTFTCFWYHRLGMVRCLIKELKMRHAYKTHMRTLCIELHKKSDMLMDVCCKNRCNWEVAEGTWYINGEVACLGEPFRWKSDARDDILVSVQYWFFVNLTERQADWDLEITFTFQMINSIYITYILFIDICNLIGNWYRNIKRQANVKK